MNKLLELLFKNRYIIIESVLIFIYLYFIYFSILILPLNIILGVICVLLLPGYNLVSILKPKFNIIQKLGYTTIFSLAINNFLMIFYYLFFYNMHSNSNNQGFFFNPKILITTIQIINFCFILFNKLKRSKKVIISYPHRENKGINKEIITFQKNQNFMNNNFFKNVVQNKLFYIYLSFILSIIFLCISGFYGNVSNNNFSTVNKDYRANFTFFYRVHFFFFIFLAISILTLTLIIFHSKNKILILISISIFFYCLWILPYLQIWNYFGRDSYELWKRYNIYQSEGIKANSNRNFNFRNKIFRYSTSIFTAILLTYATGADINVVLWFIYPLIFSSVPFYFYSVFEKFSNKDKNQKLNLIFLTIFAMSTAQFLKAAHSATTMVLGIFIYFILVNEFFDFIFETNLKLKLKNFLIIISIYYFLCLTHFEEGIYFLFLVFLYSLYDFYFQYRSIEFNKENGNNQILKNENISNFKTFNISISKDYIIFLHLNKKEIEHKIILNGLFMGSLSTIFYFTHEFFGSINFYIFLIIRDNDLLNNIFIFYRDSKIIQLPFLRGGYRLSLFIIFVIIVGSILFIVINYMLIFKYNKTVKLIFDFITIFSQRILIIFKKIIRNRYIQFLTISFLFLIIILIDLYYYPFLQEKGALLIVELILNYLITIFNIYLFIKGIQYYQLEDHKQNYFLLAVFASASIMILSFLTGNVVLTFHLLNARFIPIFIFFNLIIIQNTYFRKIMEKQKRYLIILIISILFLGVFYSLNKIGWE